MAILNGQFDATQFTPTDRSLIPAGTYKAVIKKTEIRNNSNGTGQHLNLEINLIEGQFKDRKVWENLNCWHESKKTSEIAWATLSSIARAVNVLQFNDTAALHDLPLMVQITQKNGHNSVADFKPVETTGHQPSSGRAHAQNNAPDGHHVPQNNQYIHPNGQAMTPVEMLNNQNNR